MEEHLPDPLLKEGGGRPIQAPPQYPTITDSSTPHQSGNIPFVRMVRRKGHGLASFHPTCMSGHPIQSQPSSSSHRPSPSRPPPQLRQLLGTDSARQASQQGSGATGESPHRQLQKCYISSLSYLQLYQPPHYLEKPSTILHPPRLQLF